VFSHVLDVAAELTPPGQPVVIHARPEDHASLRELAGQPCARPLTFQTGPPRADAAILRTDRFYDKARVRRRLRWGRSPEGAVIWRLDRPETLQTADEEITRRLTYQPLGKYWAFPLARRLADRLTCTRVTPNMLTLCAGVLMLGATVIVAVESRSIAMRSVTAGLMAAALVLDTADGRLARSQGRTSAFGRWLDQVLDELADIALHAAIAWAAFQSSGRAEWLLVGLVYAAGKYMFVIQSLLGEELERATSDTATETPQPIPAVSSPVSTWSRWLHVTSRLMRGLGHADFRWHLWIMLAALGRLEFALAIHAAYFPARALAGVARKVVRYG
jgi:hypothetical protein